MSIPTIQKYTIGRYIVRKIAIGTRRYPLVLMLEPLFLCNLRCKGCGKIDHPREILKKRMSVDDCVAAAQECGAPVVSVAGGEPLLHPDIHEIVRRLTALKKFVYLCTNGLLVRKRIKEFKPSPYLTFNIHLDGHRQRHDMLTGKSGVFDTAVDAIGHLLALGYRVTTNTTLYHGDGADNAISFLDFLTSLNVEGMTVAPGFGYENASDQDGFMERESIKELFKEILSHANGRGWQFNHSSLYLDFLAGRQDYSCTPWGNPTRNIFGWQQPCYLLSDGYTASFQQLIDDTDWKAYGTGNDPRCADCMVHCGFEATAVNDSVFHPLKALMVGLRGPGR